MKMEKAGRETLFLIAKKWGKIILVFIVLITCFPMPVVAETTVPQTDQTPVSSLGAPGSASQPRYISGFGTDNSFTIFYEDRADSIGCANPVDTWRIYFNQTSTGPLGLSVTSTPTNICDTHFIVKNWPIVVGATSYAYRGWGAQGNNPNHAFYVSNDLVNWNMVYLGTGMFSDPAGVLAGDSILYGFHDIVYINSHYMGFVESAGGRTYIVRSNTGDQNWTIVARVGGAVAGAGPLNLYLSPTITGPIPSGNFLLMEIGGQLVYGKLMIPGDRSAAYLAINPAAAQVATPALAEAAFLDPANWTWMDGTSGPPPPGSANAVLTSTFSSGGHDIREAWMVPTSNPRSDNVILYTARYALGGSTPRLGCASADSQCLVTQPSEDETDIDDSDLSDVSMLPATGFAPGRYTSVGRQPSEKAYRGAAVWLEIPNLGVNIPVIGVPLVDGEWDTSWLYKEAGWLNGTAFPTLRGNSVLTAHVYDFNGKPGPFVNLQHLKYGDKVHIHAWGRTYIYSVRENILTLPTSLLALKHEEKSWLTLVTCQGYNEKSGVYRYRRVVRSVLTNVLQENE